MKRTSSLEGYIRVVDNATVSVYLLELGLEPNRTSVLTEREPLVI